MTAVKETLLQVLLVLAPVFMFQIWQDHSNRMERLPFRVGLLSLLAMCLCLCFSFAGDRQVMLDLRMIPYLVGFLYGGYRVGFALTVVTFLLRYVLLGGGIPFYMISSVYLIAIPLIVLAVKQFQAASTRGKMGLAMLLYVVMMMMTTLGVLLREEVERTPISWGGGIFFVYYGIVSFGCLLVSIYVIEKTKEKWRLHDQLRIMSIKYNNEASKLRHLIDATPVTVMAVDKNMIITTINDAALYYIPPELQADMIGAHYSVITDLYHFDYRNTAILKALQGVDTQSEILEYGDMTFLVSAFGIRNVETGEIDEAVSLTLDVSELMKLRQEIGAMERLSLVGQMAASITHEIRNPMAVIRGFVQLMKERRNEQLLEQYYDVILEELDRANGIIDDFLSLAQNRIVEKEACRIEQVVRELTPLLWAEANLRGITIQLDLDEHTPELMLNRKEMKQLLLNLVRNGMDAMEEKGTLTLASSRSSEGVQLRITDTGSGIAKDQMPRLFEPFFTTKKSGTGLGLAVCLSIMERHDGSIEVNSEEGKGTTFSLSFRKAS